MNNIKGFLTSLGVTIIAKIKSESSEAYELENALFLQTNEQRDATGQPKLGINFAPISFFVNDNVDKGISCMLRKINIVLEHEIKQDLQKFYKNITSTIQIAPANSPFLSNKK